jgi:hypothetical protein
VVDTDCGLVTVFVQNATTGGAHWEYGAPVTLAWEPDATFVVEPPEEESP